MSSGADGVRVRVEDSLAGVVLEPERRIGSGGEATVYAWPRNASLAAKVWSAPDDIQRAKLARMLALPPELVWHDGEPDLAWPLAPLVDPDDDLYVVGFTMRRVHRRVPLASVLAPRSRRETWPRADWRFLVRTGRNLAAALARLHAASYVVGDLNESNVLVAETAVVTLVDCDSFQVPDGSGGVFRCRVGKPEYTAPELAGRELSELDRSVASDGFALGVLVFQLLMEGTHPFAGVWRGEGEPLSIPERIVQHSSPFVAGASSLLSPPPGAPPRELLAPPVRACVEACFGPGMSDPAARPSAAEWRDALDAADAALTVCRANPRHLFGDHLGSCPWCARAARFGSDPFPAPSGWSGR